LWVLLLPLFSLLPQDHLLLLPSIAKDLLYDLLEGAVLGKHFLVMRVALERGTFADDSADQHIDLSEAFLLGVHLKDFGVSLDGLGIQTVLALGPVVAA
jgi:hypothetical protein